MRNGEGEKDKEIETDRRKKEEREREREVYYRRLTLIDTVHPPPSVSISQNTSTKPRIGILTQCIPLGELLSCSSSCSEVQSVGSTFSIEKNN